MKMKRVFFSLLFLSLTLAIYAQSKDKNAMILRLDTVQVTDGSLVNIAKEQAAKDNNRPMAMIKTYEDAVRHKLDEVAVASGRFEISDERTIEKLKEDTQNEIAMSMSDAELIDYISKSQNDYALKCEINSCQFTRKAGGAGYSCVLRLKLTVSDARDPKATAIASREFMSDIKKTALRPDRLRACQEALASMTGSLTDFFINNIPVYGMLTFEGGDYIVNCGNNLNIKKGDQFQVSHVRYVEHGDDGMKRESEVVGVVKVQDLRAAQSVISFSEGKNRILEIIPTLDRNSFLQCRLLLLKTR